MSDSLMTTPITMTSMEMVDYINSQRADGAPTLDHADFLKKVPKVLGECAGNFSATYLVPGPNGGTRAAPCYHFPKREACLMAMSYSYELQARVFDKMTALEQAVTSVPNNFAEALRLAADQAERMDAQQRQIEQQRPAVQFLERFVEAKATKGLREVAKILALEERKFIAWLAAERVIFRQGTTWLPLAEHQHAGRLTVKAGESGGHAYHQTRFTPKGIAWIADRALKHFGAPAADSSTQPTGEQSHA